MQTQLNGITSAIPNATCPDGDTHLIINLRPQNGTLQPVTKGKNIGSLSADYNFIFLHQFNGIVNWLGVIDNQLFDNLLATPRRITVIDTPILQLQTIGNILIAVTSTGLYYLLYNKNRYTPLGYKPPFPYITYSMRVYTHFLRFNELSSIPDQQAALEALLIKNRWRNESAYKLCGIYLMRYALRLFDGTYIRHSSPILIGEINKHPYSANLSYIGDNFQVDKSMVQASLYQIKLTISTAILSQWRDIITSVDIFITTELGMISEDFKAIEDSVTSITEPSGPLRPYRTKHLQPQEINVDRIYSNITDVSNFYLIKSIPVSGTTTTITFPEKSDIATMQNIVYNEQLPIDTFSHHNISSEYTYTYNQRLHLANIKTIFSRGFGLPAFTAQQLTSYTRPGIETVVESDTRTATRPGTNTTPEKQTIPLAYIEVYLHLPDNTSACVISEVYNIEYYYINAFYSYPDIRAYKAVIYFCEATNTVYKKLELLLKPHSTLNIAYYIKPDLTGLLPEDTSHQYDSPAQNSVFTIESNKIKVSALNNPFIFPNANTYTTNGQVIAIASNAITVSEGQFGQFPLYLFTSKGIYVMEIGTEGTIAYSNITPISDEVALPGSVLPVTGAVFFLTQRGAYIISGSKTVCLSNMLNVRQDEKLTLQNIETIIEHLFPDCPFKNQSFITFITTPGISIQFNYRENEIILLNEKVKYAYVYNFNYRQWYITTHIFLPIQNTFPFLFGISKRNILDITDETDTYTPVCLLTRPLKFGSQQFKNFHRQFLRSVLTLLSDGGLFTFASNDAVHFRIKSNKRIPAGSHVDIDTGLIARNQYRYFATLFVGTLKQDSRINHLDTTIYPVYNNDKLR